MCDSRCRRNHSRKMPFRSKFCYISNSSYICIAVPGVPLSDVSADDESGFFLFTNLIHFSDYAAFVACCPCLYPYDYAAGGLFFDAATTVCRRNYSSVPRRLLQTELFFCAGDNPCCDSQIHPLKSGITARRRANPGHSLQRFSSLTPEIRNHCTQEVVNGHNLASIAKFDP